MKTKVKVKIKLTQNEVRGTLRLVTIPRASGRRRIGALRAARAAMAEQAAGADLLLVHDPELLLVLPPKGKRPPTVWDVHEDTAAALTTKAWLPAGCARSRPGGWPGRSTWPSAACT